MELTPQKRKKAEKLANLLENGNLAILEYLLELDDKIESEIPSIKEVIARVKGDKGDSYVLTQDDKETIAEVVRYLIDDKEIANKVYDLIDFKAIAREASTYIPTPKDGKNGEKGKDGVSPDPLEIASEASKIAIEAITPLIPTVEEVTKNVPILGERVRDALELLEGEERLDASAIKNLPEATKTIVERVVATGGGTQPVKAGTNITITYDGNGAPVINATGGSGGETNYQEITANGLGQTQDITKGLLLQNTTPAANNAQQLSPAIRLSGRGRATSGGGSSQSVDFYIDNLPVQGTTAPSGTLRIRSSINGGGYVDRLTLTSGGVLTVASIVAAGGITATSGTSVFQNVSINQNLNAPNSTGAYIRNYLNTELVRWGDTSVGFNVWRFSSSAEVRFDALTANTIALIGSSKQLATDPNFTYIGSTRRLGVGTSDPLATGHFESAIGTGIAATNAPTVTIVTASSVGTPSGTSASQINVFDHPSGPSASQDFSGDFTNGSYTDDSTTWDFEYYAYDSQGKRSQYAPTTAQVVEGGSSSQYTINHAWGGPSVGDISPSGYKIRRVNDDTWVDVGNVTSWTDDNTAWGSSAAGAARNDLNATGASFSFDAYGAATSPSGGAYYSSGFETYPFTDDNSGNYYVIRHSATGTVKISDGVGGKTFTGSFDQNASALPEGIDFSTTSYGFSPNGDDTRFKIITRDVLLGVTLYATSGETTVSNDPTNPYAFSPISWNNTGADEYIVAFSTDGGSTWGSFSAGTATSIAFDALSTTGGAPTQSPTSVIFAAGLFARATSSFTDQPVLTIKSLHASTPSPYISFTNSSDATIGKFGIESGNWKFSGTTPPSVTGSRGGNAALASLLTTLATMGLITNSTTA